MKLLVIKHAFLKSYTHAREREKEKERGKRGRREKRKEGRGRKQNWEKRKDNGGNQKSRIASCGITMRLDKIETSFFDELCRIRCKSPSNARASEDVAVNIYLLTRCARVNSSYFQSCASDESLNALSLLTRSSSRLIEDI